MKYYKVVTKDLLSYIDTQYALSMQNEKFIIQYKIGEFVKPKIPNSQLFVFNSLEEAQQWHMRGLRLFECEVKNPRKAKICPVWLPMEEFWKLIKNKKKTVRHCMDTQYMRGCDEIKLTKELQE